jgi:acetyl-CoA acetyltransferase
MTIYAEKNTAITGIAQSDIYRRPEKLPFELALKACEDAIADAGLRPEDIDGAAFWPPVGPGTVAGIGAAGIADVACSLGLELNWWSDSYCAAQLSPIMEAVAAIAAGYATHVLCWRAVGERSAPKYTEGKPQRVTGWHEFLAPYYAPSAAIWIACYASAHMTRHGITREQLGAIAVNARRNAAFNPKAIYREPLALDDYMSARMIASPLCLYDCDIPSDAATAVVVSRLDAARDLKHRPIVIEAIAAATRDRQDTWLAGRDFPLPSAFDTAAMMWARTDFKPKDVGSAHLYDGFSWLTLDWIEALGFCGRGEAGAFVEGGARIALDGELPLHTNGGQLSEGRTHGFGHLHEAVLQLRGTAGARQVHKPINASVVSVGGGSSMAGAALLRRDD